MPSYVVASRTVLTIFIVTSTTIVITVIFGMTDFQICKVAAVIRSFVTNIHTKTQILKLIGKRYTASVFSQ